MKTKTKTFQPESDLGDLIDWFVNQIETEDIEVPYSGAEPSLDIVSITNKKYTITIKSSLTIHPNEVTNTQKEKSDNDAKDNGFPST